jgi:hypothetical protein
MKAVRPTTVLFFRAHDEELRFLIERAQIQNRRTRIGSQDVFQWRNMLRLRLPEEVEGGCPKAQRERRGLQHRRKGGDTSQPQRSTVDTALLILRNKSRYLQQNKEF